LYGNLLYKKDVVRVREGTVTSSYVYLRSKDGNTVYVYVNEKNEKGGYSRICIGHLDPVTGDIVPNRQKARVQEAKVRSYGINMLLRDISDTIGLTDALRITFTDTWDSILSCAFFCLAENMPMVDMGPWMEFNETPRMWPLSTEDLLSIMRTISQEDIDSFFRVWKKRTGDERFVISMLSVDRSVEKANKRDLEKLFSTEIELCYGKDSGLPVGYHLHPTGFRNLYEMFSASERFGWADGDNSEYVIEENQTNAVGLDSIIPMGIRNTAEIPKDNMLFTRMISEHRINDVMHTPRVSTVQYRYDGKVRFIHMHYDPGKAEVEISRFLNMIGRCRYELTSRQYVPSHVTIYSKYFINHGSGTVELNSEAIMARNNAAGIRMNISNHIQEPMEANKWYRYNGTARELLEKVSNDKDMVALKLYLQVNFVPRMFIQFIAFILNNALEDRMRRSCLADLTVHNILYRMKRMIRVNIPSRKNPLMSEMDDIQKRIMEALLVMKDSHGP